MAEFAPGDVVVLKSGSMRMLVETVDGDRVGVVWANDGGIGRESLPVFALNKWEDRGPREDRPARAPYRGGDDGDRPARSFGGDRKGGGKPYAGKSDRGDKGDGPPRPRAPKAGMDGKPRQKTFYRKEE